MYHHRAIVSYKGSNFFGWQDLGASTAKPTVQREVHQVLKKICNYQNCIVAGASRTDAGVHAQGQVAKFTLPIEIESEKLQQGMNSLLPKEIRILDCEPSCSKFNPNLDSISKKYHYYFCTAPIFNPVLNDIVVHLVAAGKNDPAVAINIMAMKQACKLFIGEHDFYGFAARGANTASTVRTVFDCQIVGAEFPGFSNGIYCLQIQGDGFLKQMVRYIAGALFEVGRETLDMEQIREALATRQEHKLSPKAKPHGLHLMEIIYQTVE